MLEANGYTIEKCLRASSRSEVYTAVRDADGTEVVLKAYPQDAARDPGVCAPGDVQASRVQLELEAHCRVAGPGVGRALEVYLARDRPVLVLERIVGVQLDRFVRDAQLSPKSFLDIAVQLTDIVARVHAARLLHRNIKPSNVLVHPETLGVHLIDFGFACGLASVEPVGGLRKGTALAGDTLRYIAPEGTGRMARGVDARSDLYSVGATLYFALAGRAPFESTDPLALIHSHLALVPAPPAEIRPELPRALSDIVMKLLSKEPEERYQSACSLNADLRMCQEQLAASGSIGPDLVLGLGDAPTRPLFEGKLHGRSAEIEWLRSSYQRAVNGVPELLLVYGPAGVGKSSLIDALRGPLLATGGYLAHTKLDPYRCDQPYAAFSDAFHGLADQWLAQSEAQLEQWKTELCRALGPIAGALVDLAPELVLVLGEVAPVPQVGPKETRERLSLAVRRFVGACARKAHPLVICLDDLHWADPGSLFLLESLLASHPAEALLVVATYRDTDSNAGRVRELTDRLRRSGACVRELALEPLSLEASVALLADVLQRSREDVQWLAQCVKRKTGNSPLLIQSFIGLMHERGALNYDREPGWTWDEAAFEEADISDDAVALVAQRIEQLEPNPRNVLAIASCIGDTFTLERLVALSSHEPAEVEEALCALSNTGLIAPCRTGLRFVHDRIREAARGLLSETERAKIHYDSGCLYLSRTAPEALDDRAADIADHLNRARQLLSEEERVRLIAIDLTAGRRALAAGSPQSADSYLAAGLSLLQASDWEDHPQLSFDLLLESAGSALGSNAVDRALELLDQLEPHARSIEQWSRMTAMRIRASAISRSAAETTALVRQGLRRLGLRWPHWPSLARMYWSILHTDWTLRHIRAGAQPVRDASVKELRRARIRLLSAGAPALAGQSRRLALIAMAWRNRMSARNGYVRSPGVELMAFGTYAYYFWPRHALLQQYVEIGMTWSERLDDPRSQLRARFILHGMVNPWLMPRRSAVAPLRTLVEPAAELGEQEFVTLCTSVHSVTRACSGVPLALIESEMRAQLESGDKPPVDLLALLRSGGEDRERVRHEIEALRQDPLVPSGVVFSMAMLVLHTLGYYADALELVGQLSTHAYEQIVGMPSAADVCLFRGLAAGALATSSRGSARRAHVRLLRANHRQMQRWAVAGPDFVHMASLLEAELAAARGIFPAAQFLYERAARLADRQGYVHHAALAHERRAWLFRGLRLETRAHEAMREAIRRFKSWGATAKLALLQSGPA